MPLKNWKLRTKIMKMSEFDLGSEKKIPICICWQGNELEALKRASHQELVSVSEFLRMLFHVWLKEQIQPHKK